MTEQRKPNKAGIAALVAAAVAISAPLVARFEGNRNHPYWDAVRVRTVCKGHTGGVEERYYSDAECDSLFRDDLAKHASGVVACTPEITDRPEVLAAATSFAFNVGVSRYCRSSVAANFKAGRIRAGCQRIGAFVYAGRRKLPGLVRRRAAEVALCLKGVK